MELETIEIGFSNLFLQYFQNVSIYYGKSSIFQVLLLKIREEDIYWQTSVQSFLSPISLQKTPEKINVNFN